MTRAAIRHASETIVKAAADALLCALEIACIGIYIAGIILGIGLACGAI